MSYMSDSTEDDYNEDEHFDVWNTHIQQHMLT